MTDRKTVLISGGNRGIGAATGRAFMEAGWKVSLECARRYCLNGQIQR